MVDYNIWLYMMTVGCIKLGTWAVAGSEITDKFLFYANCALCP